MLEMCTFTTLLTDIRKLTCSAAFHEMVVRKSFQQLSATCHSVALVEEVLAGWGQGAYICDLLLLLEEPLVLPVAHSMEQLGLNFPSVLLLEILVEVC